MEDIILLEKYLMEVIRLIITYESLQSLVYEQTKTGLVKIPAKIPKELLELKNNVENKLRDSKIKYYAREEKLSKWNH